MFSNLWWRASASDIWIHTGTFSIKWGRWQRKLKIIFSPKQTVVKSHKGLWKLSKGKCQRLAVHIQAMARGGHVSIVDHTTNPFYSPSKLLLEKIGLPPLACQQKMNVIKRCNKHSILMVDIYCCCCLHKSIDDLICVSFSVRWINVSLLLALR